MEIIKLKNVVKRYKKKIVLGPINLTIDSSSAIAVFGDNGAGKTTLCEIISNSKSVSSGSIKYSFAYNEIPYLMGLNFQDQKYPSSLTVKEIITFYYRLYKKQINNDEFKKMLKKFSIKPLFKNKIEHLSGGQRQRVNLCLALFHKPRIFIGDEISTGLDIKTKVEVINFLKDQMKVNKITLILVSHNWEEIQLLCKRVIFLRQGKIIDDTTVSAITKKYGSLLNYYLTKTKNRSLDAEVK